MNLIRNQILNEYIIKLTNNSYLSDVNGTNANPFRGINTKGHGN